MTDMTRSEFVRKEVINRSRFELGMYPYQPDKPCVIMHSNVEYRCGCGFRTSSTGEIWDHKQECK